MNKPSLLELEQERQSLMSNFWDADNKRWKTSTEEERKELQTKYHNLRHAIRECEEELLLNTPATPEDVKARLFPLVQRRQYTFDSLSQIFPWAEVIFNSPEGTVILDKDGDLFCFEEEKSVEITELFCGCGAIPDGWQPANTRDLAVANEHLRVCENKIEKKHLEPVQRLKHVRGDWDCKACLNTGTRVHAPEGLAELASRKYLEWCPNFPEWARTLSIDDYLNSPHKKFATVESMKCYAGLVHSQLILGERQTIHREGQNDLVIQPAKLIKLCDTCGYHSEEDKSSQWEDAETKEVNLEKEG